jgi:[acyl-carrier-protein] S-malonyltransferase
MTKRTVPDARTFSLAKPEDLDELLEWVNAVPVTHSATDQFEGEHLFAAERLVVSPAAGVFEPTGEFADGALITVGEVLGRIGETEVRSAFAGVLQSYIAVSGERVTLRQPIAWLRTN